MRNDPLIIGGLGGSGTRIVARLVRAGGVFMGRWLNEAEDSEPIQNFYNAWLRRYVAQGGYLDSSDRTEANKQFRDALEDHLAGFKDAVGAWGVKVPRSILMLEFWQQQFPGFKFLHVIRNGLDMAYSTDHRQLRMVGDLVLNEIERSWDEKRQAIGYWCHINAAAADFGEQYMGPRYMRIRFEDLCTTPVSTSGYLATFSNELNSDVMAQAATRMVAPPASRWQQQPVDDIHDLVQIGGAVLQRFGY